MNDNLLQKLKANAIIQHFEDDDLLKDLIASAVTYAEGYQHVAAGYYSQNAMSAATEHAVIILATHFYESRDGSTGGFFGNSPQAAEQVWTTVKRLLSVDRNWVV